MIFSGNRSFINVTRSLKAKGSEAGVAATSTFPMLVQQVHQLQVKNDHWYSEFYVDYQPAPEWLQSMLSDEQLRDRVDQINKTMPKLYRSSILLVFLVLWIGSSILN